MTWMWGHHWVVLAVVVESTFAHRSWALPRYWSRSIAIAKLAVNDLGAQPGYDSHNRLLKQTDTHQDSVSRTYDRHGNVLTSTDSRNKTTAFTYDYRDRKVSMIDRVSGVTGYAYDKANHLTEITDADSAVNGKTIYAFDSRGYLQSETFPAGKDGKKTVRTYGYDNGGRLSSRTVTTSPAATPVPLNEVTTYGYDAANRLASRSYNDGRGNDAFTYDKVGRLLVAVSGRYENSVVRSYSENSEKGGRLTSEKLTLGGTNAGSWKVSYKYDVLDRLTDITYPTGELIKRTYTTRHQLSTVTMASASVANRTYDNGGRLLTTTLGNNLVETRTYRSDANGVDDQLATQSIPGVTSFTYSYDANKRITQETNGLFAAHTQQFLAYDDENRLTSWKRGASETQTWTLSKVGDWTSTTINGVPQSRTHSAVHEVTAVAGVPLSYDLKGNLTQNLDGSLYGWDSENRLSSASVTEPTRALNDTAFYRYDALGRRVQKQVFGMATTYVHHGAQVVHEFDAKIQLPATATGEDGDGSGTPPGGGILQGAGVTRINFQPARSQIPPGFFADKGKTFDLRTNGKSYGWKDSPQLETLARNQHPWPQFDTFNQCWLNNAGTAGTWEVALANGTYAVVVILGDAASANQTNHLDIEGQLQTDPDPAVVHPPTYQYGDFDGYAVTATVADGKLTLSVPTTANNPKLCFIEIGPHGSSITQADRDRLADAIADATAETGYGPFPKPQPTPRQYVYGSYVDEPLMMRANGNKYYYASNRLYTVAAITNQTGQVVERYTYDAYGKQTILADNGVVSYKPSDYGNFIGFTGYYGDWETGNNYARSRMYDPSMGRFLSRNAWSPITRGTVPDPYFPNTVQGDGIESYIQGRLNSYEISFGSPPNYTEPFSEAEYHPRPTPLPPTPSVWIDPRIPQIGPPRQPFSRQETTYVPVSWANPYVMRPAIKGSSDYYQAMAGSPGPALAVAATTIAPEIAVEAALGRILAAIAKAKQAQALPKSPCPPNSNVLPPASVVIGEGIPLPGGKGSFTAGFYDPRTGKLYLGPGGHFDGGAAVGGSPSVQGTPGITVIQTPEGVYWANDSMSLPYALTPSQAASVQQGLQTAFPGVPVQQLESMSQMPNATRR
jgi:RHS repeat-associated protein